MIRTSKLSTLGKPYKGLSREVNAQKILMRAGSAYGIASHAESGIAIAAHQDAVSFGKFLAKFDG